MGPPSEQRWWIVSLDIQVKSTVGSGAAGKENERDISAMGHIISHSL